jgi:hypothetical protein
MLSLYTYVCDDLERIQKRALHVHNISRVIIYGQSYEIEYQLLERQAAETEK